MVLVLFNNLSEQDKAKAIDNLISESTPRQEFFLMIILSVLMATFGLIIDNAAIIIGSMLIAPMIYPILSLSLGVVMADFGLISRSFYTLLKSALYSISAAALVTWFFGFDLEVGSEILSRANPTVIYGAIAIISGLAASFALIKPDLSETLPGVAISVSLIPPLAATGVGIAKFDWNIISNSIIMFLINIVGIVFASMIVFSLMHLYIKRTIINKIINREEKEIEEEQDKAIEEKEKSEEKFRKIANK